MAGKRAIGEAKLFNRSLFFNQIDDPGNVQRPEAEMTRQDTDGCIKFDRGLCGNCLDPPEIELFPTSYRRNCLIEERARIENSVVRGGSRIGSGSIISGAIVGKGCHIGRAVTVGRGAVLGDKTVLTNYSSVGNGS